MKNKIGKWHLLRNLLLISLLSMAFSVPSFAANNALRYKLNFTGKENISNTMWDKNNFTTAIYVPGVTKLEGEIEFSGDVIIPVSMMKSAKAEITLTPRVVINQTNEAYDYIGTYRNTRQFNIFSEKNFHVYNLDTHKEEKSSKRLSVKKQGKYYVIHFIDTINTKKTMIDYTDGAEKVNSTSDYNLGMEVTINGNVVKSGYVYLDNFTMKMKSKTIKSTLDKKDYRGYGYMNLGVFELDSNKGKIVKSPVK